VDIFSDFLEILKCNFQKFKIKASSEPGSQIDVGIHSYSHHVFMHSIQAVNINKQQVYLDKHNIMYECNEIYRNLVLSNSIDIYNQASIKIANRSNGRSKQKIGLI
jgi:hypothetical protein